MPPSVFGKRPRAWRESDVGEALFGDIRVRIRWAPVLSGGAPGRPERVRKPESTAAGPKARPTRSLPLFYPLRHGHVIRVFL